MVVEKEVIQMRKLHRKEVQQLHKDLLPIAKARHKEVQMFQQEVRSKIQEAEVHSLAAVLDKIKPKYSNKSIT